MSGSCLHDTETDELSYTESEELQCLTRIAGGLDPARQVWPYAASAQQANGLRVDPTLGPFGGLWVAPPVAIARATAPDALFPSQSIAPAAVGTHYLDDGTPNTWEVANPSPYLGAFAFVYVGCSVHFAGIAGARDADYFLQTSVNGWAGGWTNRDEAHFHEDLTLRIGALNQCFPVTLLPGGVVQVAARVRVDVGGGTVDNIARNAIQLSAIIIAAPNV